jgi:hypothetical protein
MTPVPEWRRVLLRAWSVRVNLILALFSAAGGALMLTNADPNHPYLIPGIVFVCNAIGNGGAIIARVMHQDKVNANAG